MCDAHVCISRFHTNWKFVQTLEETIRNTKYARPKLIVTKRMKITRVYFLCCSRIVVRSAIRMRIWEIFGETEGKYYAIASANAHFILPLPKMEINQIIVDICLTCKIRYRSMAGERRALELRQRFSSIWFAHQQNGKFQ